MSEPARDANPDANPDTNPDTAGDGILTVTGLTLRFGGVAALSGVSFDVRRGELLMIIGPNGAGKTSLFNCITGLARPAGSVRLAGRELVGRSPVAVARLGVARTFQNLGLFASLDVLDNLLLGRHVRMRGGVVAGMVWWGTAKRAEQHARRRAGEVLDLLDLGPYRRRRVAELPFGIRKRVELGKALMPDPRLLLLDEPVAGMNADETAETAGYVRAVQRQLTLTVAVIEHDLRLMTELADRVLVLDFGEVVCLDTPEAVRRDPAVIAAYLGGAGSPPSGTAPRLPQPPDRPHKDA